MDRDPPLALHDDVVLLLQACSAALGDRVLASVRSQVGTQVRYSDGYVFQHLVSEPCSITALARNLGVTQQAASKQVAGMEARKLVTTRPDPQGARAKRVELSELGQSAVHAGRIARRDLGAEITGLLGARGAAGLLAGLRAISEHTEALVRMEQRQIRPDSAR